MINKIYVTHLCPNKYKCLFMRADIYGLYIATKWQVNKITLDVFFIRCPLHILNILPNCYSTVLQEIFGARIYDLSTTGLFL